MSADKLALDAIRVILGEKPAAAGPTFEALWARYFREEARFLDTAKDIARIGRHLCAAWGQRAVLDITTGDAENYRDARRTTVTRRGGPPAPGTVNRELTCARRCLQWGVERRELSHNPLSGLKQEPENNVRHSKIGTEDELQRLLRLADATMQALILAQIDCGFRRMEVFTMQWDQIALVRHKGEQRPVVALWDTKNGKTRRAGLSSRTWEAICKLPRAGKYVFCGRQPGRWRAQEPPLRPGSHMDATGALRRFKRLARRAGLRTVNNEPFTFHMLRHSFAYLTRVRDRIPERTAMRQGGWITRSAFDRYGIGDESEVADMYATVDANIADDLERIKRRRGR